MNKWMIYLADDEGDYRKVEIKEDFSKNGIYGKSGPLQWTIIGGEELIQGRAVHFFGITPTEIEVKNSTFFCRSYATDIERERKEKRALLEKLLDNVDEFRKKRRGDIVVMNTPVTHHTDYSIQAVSCVAMAGYIKS